MTDKVEVRCAALRSAAKALDLISEEARADLSKLDDAVSKVVTGAPGTKTALAAARFGEKYRRQLEQRIDELADFADKLRKAADNYCGSDEEAADEINRLPGSDWLEEHAPGGGYIPPNSDYTSD